ncbi:hypothetical protein KOR42_07480 [Thalassoglobus neptunius]|uniref:Uncharacterized protein n=1 Tax=Thalassoglobus neptunius TaxID=1938619 RepID=A0A5C5X3K7_9PLAN|nr:hypothetical protein [Thalassoglobus neptunius]TWT57388.1 hypothetical protein KOR42_07480 [Thalassoglobus neptunius]
MIGTEAIFPNTHLSIVNQAAALFSQQVWCWGQDVIYPQGNILIKMGFERVPPPENRRDCSSVYSLNVNSSQRIILRGFGVFWGDDQKGGLLLLRDRFEARYLNESRLPKPCWSLQDFPNTTRPTIEQRPDCIALLIDLIDWMRCYELRTLREYGLSYRQKVLKTWNDGKRHVLHPEETPGAWRRCSHLVADQPDRFLPVQVQHA